VCHAGMCDDQMILLLEREATREREQRGGERPRGRRCVCLADMCDDQMNLSHI